MKRRPRRNPSFDCNVFNKALKFTFPKESDQKWWATKLLEAVVKSEKRFKSSIEMASSGRGLKCGPLIKAIKKITGVSNGEEWLRYGLQGYLDEAWKKADGSDMIELLMARDPSQAGSLVRKAIHESFGPFLSEVGGKEILRIIESDNWSPSLNKLTYSGDIRDPKDIAYWANWAFTWAEAIHRVSAGNSYKSSFSLDQVDRLMREHSNISLSKYILKNVPRFVV